MAIVTSRTDVDELTAYGECKCNQTNIRMCFDGGSSYSGYGQLGFDRRVRIYQISDFGETVETYKRLTTGDILDRQVLVGTGAVPGVGQDQTEF